LAARDWAARWCRWAADAEHRSTRIRPCVNEERRRRWPRCAAWAFKIRRQFGVNHLEPGLTLEQLLVHQEAAQAREVLVIAAEQLVDLGLRVATGRAKELGEPSQHDHPLLAAGR
jgi:hypothetical protein